MSQKCHWSSPVGSVRRSPLGWTSGERTALARPLQLIWEAALWQQGEGKGCMEEEKGENEMEVGGLEMRGRMCEGKGREGEKRRESSPARPPTHRILDLPLPVGTSSLRCENTLSC